MSLSRLLGFLTRSTKKASSGAVPDGGEAERFFALRHHSFKLFLTAWNKFQETMTEVEYTLCCDHPFGLYRVRALCTRGRHPGLSVHPAIGAPGSHPWPGALRTLRGTAKDRGRRSL